MNDFFGNKIEDSIAQAMNSAKYEFPLQVTGIRLISQDSAISDVIAVAVNNLSLVLQCENGSFTIMLNSLPITTFKAQSEDQLNLPGAEVGNNSISELIAPPVHDGEEQS